VRDGLLLLGLCLCLRLRLLLVLLVDGEEQLPAELLLLRGRQRAELLGGVHARHQLLRHLHQRQDQLRLLRRE
jgi:hypothetical protein